MPSHTAAERRKNADAKKPAVKKSAPKKVATKTPAPKKLPTKKVASAGYKKRKRA